MATCPSPEQLRRLLTHELAAEDYPALEAHLEKCAPCQNALEDLTRAEPTRRLGAPADGGELESTCLAFLDRCKEEPPATVRQSACASDTARLAAPPPDIPGYELLGELGHGGMGVVYRARHVRLNRLVALKMIRAGAHASPALLARFHVEAEALASVQHPNIVQVFEVGAHDGCPYLAMEFVNGGSLRELLAHQSPPARAAAELVEALARAMHVAHLRGIVHRDLKPGNILLVSGEWPPDAPLTPHPSPLTTPKVTDFGLAKRLTEGKDQTCTGVVMGTPGYMAPEQAAGRNRAIGPATDIYALGAILYEMLTGQPPFHGDGDMDTLRKTVSEEPAAPRRLRPRVPRDLDTICLRCLEKEPAKRYATAEALADDLHCFLDGKPIAARPAGVSERLWKWAKRRPALATLFMVIVVAVLALAAEGVSWSIQVRRERDRAEANLEMAMRAVDDMLTEVGEEQLAYEPRMEVKRRRLLQKAQALYLEFLKQRYDSPRIRLQTALASRRVADIHRLLGEYREAEAAYGDAIRRFSELQAGDANNPAYRLQLAAAWNYRGEARRYLGDAAGAEQAYGEALGLYDILAAEEPDHAETHRERALTHMNLGILRSEQEDWPEADNQLRLAVEQLDVLTRRQGHEPSYRQYLARARLNRGPALRRVAGPAAAEASYEAAIHTLRDLHHEVPEQPDYRHELGVALNNLGNLRAGLERFGMARAAYEEAVALFRDLATDFPKVPVYRQELANSYNSLGAVHASEKNLDRAAEQWQHALQILAQLAVECPDVPGYAADRARLLGNLGWAEAEQGHWSRARDSYRKAIDVVSPAAGKHPENPQYRTILRDQYQSLAETELQLGDYRGAGHAAQALADVFPDVSRDRFFAACFMARCVPLIRSDPHLDDGKRANLEKEYRANALTLLRTAIARGYGDKADLKKQQHEAFHCFADDQEFQALFN